jgi:hypothetical protein
VPTQRQKPLLFKGFWRFFFALTVIAGIPPEKTQKTPLIEKVGSIRSFRSAKEKRV